MCGIAGLVGAKGGDARGGDAESRVRRALALLRHRGPDGEGLHVAAGAVLGMRRLAIIDVTGGDQPIYDESRELAVVCNGEIYNHPELFEALRARGHRLQSASDVNVIPHLYEEEGPAAVRHWRGMFAAALWDERQQRLVLWRDRVGKKPLFYAIRGGALAFASELPALLALLGHAPEIEPAAMREYLRLGFVPHPMTIYRDVWALPPGCQLVMQAGGEPVVTRYWDRHEVPPFAGTRAEALDAVSAALRDATAVRLRSDVPIGLFLSGGIDSGLVASYAVEAGARDLLCFVVEVDDPALNEAGLARQTAAKLGLPVEPIPLRIAPVDVVERVALAYGQPFADSSAIPSLLVSEAAAPHRRVVLNGDGGDEVFAGYRRYRMAELWGGAPAGGVPGLDLLGRTVARIGGRRSKAGFAARALRGWGLSERERYLAWSLDLLDESALARMAPTLDAARCAPRLPAQGVGPVERRCRSLRDFLWTDTRLILADNLLTKMDIATMQHSVEARSPFLDVPLMELSWSLPSSYLLSGATTKPLLRALASSRLPADVVRAPKRGFEVPVARWLAHDLRELLGDTVLAADARVGTYLDRGAVARFVAGTDGFAGNHPQAVWALLMLELFLRGAARG